MELDRERIVQIVEELSERLDGEWLLLGGALVAVWLEPRRVTEDIDIISLRGAPDDRYALMEVAAEMGLPVEAVNSAADFFVQRVDGWREETEVFARGSRATIHRPTATLFLLLKIRRLTARDLEDCLAMVARARTEGLAMDVGRVIGALDALPNTEDEALAARRSTLREALG